MTDSQKAEIDPALANASRLAARCREDYVRVSNESGGVWTFCATCPRRGQEADRG